jgi:hypothetical protein
MRLTTPQSSRQGIPLAIDDLRASYRTRSGADRLSELSRSDFVLWPEAAVGCAAAIFLQLEAKRKCLMHSKRRIAFAR